MTKKAYSLAEISEFLNLESSGDPSVLITGIAPLEKAGENQISFLDSGKLRKLLSTTKAGAVILSPRHAELYVGNMLLADNPLLAYAKLTTLFCDEIVSEAGISTQAVIGEDCNIHNSVRIAANCVIGNGVTIDKNSVIGAGCVIGDGVKIGADCHLHANVTIYCYVHIGDRAIIHSGAVLGADGFGMVNDNGVWCKIHQLGSIKIGNDVEIGANTCIDRGALEDTVIEDGVKLDNQIQVAHNVRIGAHTVIAGCTGIAGSTKIGRYCMIAGAVSFKDHVEIPDQTVITGGSIVSQSITEPGVYTSGIVSAQPHRKWLRAMARLLQLDDFMKKFKG